MPTCFILAKEEDAVLIKSHRSAKDLLAKVQRYHAAPLELLGSSSKEFPVLGWEGLRLLENWYRATSDLIDEICRFLQSGRSRSGLTFEDRARAFGANPATVRARMRRGMSERQALTAPVRLGRKPVLAPTRGAQLEAARLWLEGYLSTSRPARDVIASGEAAGHQAAFLYRAALKLGVVVRGGTWNLREGA